MCAGVFNDADLAAQSIDKGDLDGAERLLNQIDEVYGYMRKNSNAFPELQPVWKLCRELRSQIKQARNEEAHNSSKQYELYGAATCQATPDIFMGASSHKRKGPNGVACNLGDPK